MDKAADAFRTISEVAEELGIQQHVLRFWETKFTQIKPLKRGGGRRYYRPDDVDLLRGIRYLLYGQGYTIKGVQRIIKEHGPKAVIAAWIELSAAEGDERAPVPMPSDVGPEELEATSDVSEQLFVTVRDFSEQDDAQDGQSDAPAEGQPAAPKRPDFQPRPDVSIMRGGLQGKATRPGILPLRSLGPKSDIARPDQAEGDGGFSQHGASSPGAHILSAADRASLAAVLEDLAACRRVLDAAGRS